VTEDNVSSMSCCLSVIHLTKLQIIGRLMDEELEKKWKEVAVNYFRALSWHSPRRV
jgi:hypothetical protein